MLSGLNILKQYGIPGERLTGRVLKLLSGQKAIIEIDGKSFVIDSPYELKPGKKYEFIVAGYNPVDKLLILKGGHKVKTYSSPVEFIYKMLLKKYKTVDKQLYSLIKNFPLLNKVIFMSFLIENFTIEKLKILLKNFKKFGKNKNKIDLRNKEEIKKLFKLPETEKELILFLLKSEEIRNIKEYKFSIEEREGELLFVHKNDSIEFLINIDDKEIRYKLILARKNILVKIEAEPETLLRRIIKKVSELENRLKEKGFNVKIEFVTNRVKVDHYI